MSRASASARANRRPQSATLSGRALIMRARAMNAALIRFRREMLTRFPPWGSANEGIFFRGASDVVSVGVAGSRGDFEGGVNNLVLLQYFLFHILQDSR